MNADGIAIVTPSFARDLALCRTLNRSILEFFAPAVEHFIVVDQRDFRLFASLDGGRTHVVAKEDILPPGIRRLGGLNRWHLNGTLIPMSGWLIQQIVKISIAAQLHEPNLLMVDSDAVFVRDVDPALFAYAGKTRLFKSPGAIAKHMKDHVRWHKNAARLLGTHDAPPPLDDYIGQVISWRRDLVLAMCARIEEVNHQSWVKALATTMQVSEYLLYGVFVENTATARGAVWIDENPRCNLHWEDSPVALGAVASFLAALNPDDIALMISAHSRTANDVRELIVKEATNGRLLPEKPAAI